MRIGIIAGETSGDLLGASLIQALKKIYPDAQFEGIAGPAMQAVGAKSLYPMETLSVMGIAAILKRLPAILKIRRGIIRYFIQNPPDLFIGIDAPDFNLTVEDKLHQHGIKTVHYVSPSIWAWKAGRIKKIKRATDLVLCILPFEVDIYQKHQHPAVFVGHPLADQIPLVPNVSAARERLQLNPAGPYLALLPGSRVSELHYLLKPFLQAARLCQQAMPDLNILLPLARPSLQATLDKEKTLVDQLNVQVFAGQAQAVIAAADVVLLASGTATLEAMLLKKPMVVAYKFGAFSYWVARLMVKIRRFSLPNILAGEALVPELFQQQVTAENAAAAILAAFKSTAADAALIQRFTQLHEQLRQNASERAAQAIHGLIKRHA